MRCRDDPLNPYSRDKAVEDLTSSIVPCVLSQVLFLSKQLGGFFAGRWNCGTWDLLIRPGFDLDESLLQLSCGQR